MSQVETYLYQSPTAPLRDWLRLQTLTPSVGGPGAQTARIFASNLPGGCDFPAIAFHRAGGGVNNTVDLATMQFDCYGLVPEDAETLAASLASLLASTPPRTRLTPTLVLEGPGVIVGQLYLPTLINRTPRQVLTVDLVFAAGF